MNKYDTHFWDNAIQEAIDPLNNALIHHPLYGQLLSREAIQIFMRHHVYAVWDFMMLLKALQNRLTCVSIPWFPKGDPELRFLINEIVLSEESDTDAQGRRASHFEMYLQAMQEAGADTAEIITFTQVLESSGDWEMAFQKAKTPQVVRDFVLHTHRIASGAAPHEIAAAFTYGREKMIPENFPGVLHSLSDGSGVNLPSLRYYLERHIEVDGGHHQHLAERMVQYLCGDHPAKWEQALKTAVSCLTRRQLLWDAILKEINIEKGKAG